MRYLFNILLFAWLAAPVAASVAAADLDRFARPYIESGTTRGMVIAVYAGGQTTFRGYGHISDKDSPAPDAETLFEVGSITKVFTALLLADGIERGVLKRDTPVNELLPEDAQLADWEDKPVTLANLSTHTSGLPRMPGNFAPADPANPFADYDEQKLHACLREVKLKTEPGTHYVYSNLGAGLLGYVLAGKAEMTYEKLVHQRICEPLRLTSTRITLSDDDRKRLARGHDASGKPAANWDITALAGAGALRSNAKDMMRFARLNMQAGDDADATLSAAMQLTHQRRRDTAQPPGGIALGWRIAADGSTYWHNGGTGGYRSFLGFNHEHDFAVVVLANTSTPQIDVLADELMRLAAGAPVKPRVFRKSVSVDAKVLKQYVGVYELAPQFKLTVTLEDDKLMVQATGQARYEVFAESRTKFFYKVVDAQITFADPKDGKSPRLTLHQNGRDMPAQRVE